MSVQRITACPFPENINPLTSNGFMFRLDRIPEMSYFSQKISIPTLTAEPASVGTPLIRYDLAGDQMVFDTLSVDFLVDAEMKNYIALFNWIRGSSFPEDNRQYTDQVREGIKNGKSEVQALESDATMVVLNNLNTPIQTIRFVDCIITSLGALNFDSTNETVNYVTANATFAYSYYDFVT